MKTNFLPSAWAGNSVTMKETCLQSAASTQLKVKRVTRLVAQLVQRVAKVGFLVVINLATDTILGTAYTDKHIEKKAPRKAQ